VGVGFTTRPTDCLQVCLPSLASFLIIPDVKTVQAPLGITLACKYVELMRLLYLSSPSRRPGGRPAGRAEERAVELRGGGGPLGSRPARLIFTTAVVALRGRERTAVGRLSVHTTMKTVRGDETTDSKRRCFPRPRCWTRGNASEAPMDSLAPTVRSNSRAFETKHLIFHKKMKFLERPSSLSKFERWP